MTLEIFNSPIWTGGIELRYCSKNYKVISVDFEEKSVCLERENNEAFTVNYRYVELGDTCIWGYDNDFEHSHFIASCGFEFEFSDDRNSPADYEFNFCPKCGSRIKEHDNE